MTGVVIKSKRKSRVSADVKDKLETFVINRESEHEIEICKHFGCGKTLTLRERLFGNRCGEHSKVK